MTNDLERTFFDTFGIKPKELIFKTMNCACGCHDCENCDKYKNNFSKTYPQITDRILLGLICINEDEQPNIEWLKQCILENLIHRFEKNLFCDKEQAVKQVRTLFKETK